MVPLEKYAHATANQTLREAAEALDRNRIEIGDRVSMPRILLVFDDDGHLVGMARRRDLLRGLAPSFLVESRADHPELLFDVDVDPNLSDMLSGHAGSKLRARAEAPISEIVEAMDVTAAPDDPLIRIIGQMVRHDMAHLPVVEDDHVVGVLRTIEVLEAVAKIMTDDEG